MTSWRRLGALGCGALLLAVGCSLVVDTDGLAGDAVEDARAADVSAPDGSTQDSSGGDGGSDAQASGANYLVWVGGYVRADGGATVETDAVYTARQMPDGTLDPWRQAVSLPVTVSSGGGVVAVGAYIFATAGGHLYRSSFKASGELEPFVDQGNDLPAPAGGDACLAEGNSVLYSVSRNGGVVAYATILNGLVGGWKFITAMDLGEIPVPVARVPGALVAISGVAAFRSPLETDGTPGPWAPMANPPRAGTNFGVYAAPLVARDTYVYMIGGFTSPTGSSVTEVHYVDTADARTPDAGGGWKSTEAFDGSRYSMSAAVVDDRIYVVGGWGSQGKTVATVSFTQIKSDHSLDVWQSTAPFLGGARGGCRLAAVRGP